MKIGLIIRYVGTVLLINAVFMLLSALVSLFNDFDTAFYPLLLSFVITSIIGLFPIIFVPHDSQLSTKESYVIVIASWIMCCLLGMLPFIIWGGEFTLLNSWFESTSGFTTTGATILNNVEALPKGLLFWRASTHWIGGVGVVLFALVVLPAMGRSKMSLSSAEMSTLAKDNFRYTTRKVLRIILMVYVGLTFVIALTMLLLGMDWLDSVTTAFSTIATGGFSTRNLSIMYYNSLAIEMALTFFMALAGVHMGLIYTTVCGRKNNMFRSEVLRFYVLSMVVCTLLVAGNLWKHDLYDGFGEALRYGSFQVVSYMTTTGFASTNDAFWPPLAMAVMIYCLMQCAMAGSSTGGLKADRILILFKAIKARIVKIQHPNAVVRIRLNGMPQDDSLVNASVLLIVFYLMTALAGTILLTAMDLDLLTSFTASITCMSNVGPGFGEISNMNSYAGLPDAAKLVLTGLMLFGRLELFGFIHIFMLRSWR